MNSVLQAVRKTPDYIEFAWNPEDGASPQSYKIYAGKTPDSATMSLLATVSSSAVQAYYPTALGKVYYKAEIATVRTALTISSTLDFSNLLLYYTMTYVEGGVESNIALSTVISVPPVGINSREMKDDPTINRHPYVWADGDQRWYKQAGSGWGGVAVDSAAFYKINEIQEYTRDASGNPLTMKAYLSDATLPGSYAKLVTYDYTGGYVSKITVTDSTV